MRELSRGRHLIADDEDRARPVAVIGADLVDAFFNTAEPLGKAISIDGYELRVVGVAARKGKIFGESQDNFVWIPIDTFRKMVGSRRSITIQAAGRLHGPDGGGPGPGARDHARAPAPGLRQARRLQHRDRRDGHGVLAERHARASTS